jgi:RTX calcium-binding nonapeptide repeat (4 copies)
MVGLSLLGFFVLAQSSAASVRCRHNPASRVLSVTASGEDEVVIRRVGPALRVFELFLEPIDCGGGPATVTDTDEIKLVPRGESEIIVSLAGGPLAPGASPEPDSSPEIEITAGGFIGLLGGRRGDHLRFMASEGQTGINLNADEDQDLDFRFSPTQPLFLASGGPGDDTIDSVGRLNLLLLVEGNAGNDTISLQGARHHGAIVDGNAGDDRIIGSSGFDLIAPGSGADVVEAGSGPDTTFIRPDRRRDRIGCGPGHDRVRRFGLPHPGTAADPFDRLRSCERVERRR